MQSHDMCLAGPESIWFELASAAEVLPRRRSSWVDLQQNRHGRSNMGSCSWQWGDLDMRHCTWIISMFLTIRHTGSSSFGVTLHVKTDIGKIVPTGTLPVANFRTVSWRLCAFPISCVFSPAKNVVTHQHARTRRRGSTLPWGSSIVKGPWLQSKAPDFPRLIWRSTGAAIGNWWCW